MHAGRSEDQWIARVNAAILVVIVLLYAVTGTHAGENVVAALSSGTIFRGKADGTVALEFVVAWDASALGDILDELEESGVSATFFVSGEWANAHAAQLEQMAAAGHEIGTCGYEPLLDGDETLIERDIAASAGVISRITGQEVALYCPWLRDTAVSAKAAKTLGMTCVMASLDLQTARYGANEIVSRASEYAFEGGILLMQPTGTAAKALPDVLATLEEKGLAVVTVGELQGKNG